jgi:hypothetical protein
MRVNPEDASSRRVPPVEPGSRSSPLGSCPEAGGLTCDARGRSPYSPSNGDLVAGYSRMVEDRVRDGWSCDLVTFVFDQLPRSDRVAYVSPQLSPSEAFVADLMKDHVERVYRTLATRVCRRPRTARVDRLPFLVGFLDLPVSKGARKSSPLHRTNGGLHFHALVLLPPTSRLQGTLADHFRERAHLYEGGGLRRVDVRPVDPGTHGEVVDYVLKTVRRGLLRYDDAVLLLPRVGSELG